MQTFHFHSGILTSYITWNLTNGVLKNFSIIGYMIIKYCKLTPQIIVFILLTLLLPFLNDGPLWNRIIIGEVNNCYDKWWTNLLYVQNYYNDMVNWLVCIFITFFYYILLNLLFSVPFTPGCSQLNINCIHCLWLSFWHCLSVKNLLILQHQSSY